MLPVQIERDHKKAALSIWSQGIPSIKNDALITIERVNSKQIQVEMAMRGTQRALHLRVSCFPNVDDTQGLHADGMTYLGSSRCHGQKS